LHCYVMQIGIIIIIIIITNRTRNIELLEKRK